MALVKFKKGKKEKLPTTKEEGTFYVTTDDHKLLLDISSNERITLTGEGSGGTTDANEIYFSSDLIYTEDIGTKKVPASGYGTIAAKGKSVQTVLSDILGTEKNPTIIKPSANIVINNGVNYVTEIGNTVDITYSISFDPGKYQYGPETGVTATGYSVTFDGKTNNAYSGTFSNITATDTQKKASAVVTWKEGSTTPVTNLGNASPAGKINPGQVNIISTNYLLGTRYMFWGTMTANSSLTSATIRALSNSKAAATGTITHTAGANAVKVVVAVPTARTISKVLLTTSMNADITRQFVEQANTVSVNGGNGYSAIAYRVYVYSPASIGAAETYSITIS